MFPGMIRRMVPGLENLPWRFALIRHRLTHRLSGMGTKNDKLFLPAFSFSLFFLLAFGADDFRLRSFALDFFSDLFGFQTWR